MSSNQDSNGNKRGASPGKQSTPSKRKLEASETSGPSKSPYRGASGASVGRSGTPTRPQASPAAHRGARASPSQPAKLTLPQVKRLTTTPYSNAMTFLARAIKVEPPRRHFDSRVLLHRQKVVFADQFTILTVYMHTDKNEDPTDPKILEGYTHAVTNFRVVKKGDIVIHDKTETELAHFIEIPQLLLDAATKAFTQPFSPVVDLEFYTDSANSIVSGTVTVIKTENVRSVKGQYTKVAYCRNITVVANKTAFVLTLWDNAAIYTSLEAGNRIQLNDVKVGNRDDTPVLTARFCDQIQILPPDVIPTAVKLLGFNTKAGPTTVTIRATIDDNPRLYDMDRYKFTNLFPQQQLSSNLRELTQCLPVVGVAYLDGLTIKEFDVFPNLEEATEHIDRLAALPPMSDDDDSSFFPDPTEKVKKQLHFGSSSTSTTPSAATSSSETPNSSSAVTSPSVPPTRPNTPNKPNPFKDDGTVLCYDSRRTTSPQRGTQVFKHKDMFSLTQGDTSTTTTPPPPNGAAQNVKYESSFEPEHENAIPKSPEDDDQDPTKGGPIPKMSNMQKSPNSGDEEDEDDASDD